jgi:predicted nucleic acid-binding protein
MSELIYVDTNVLIDFFLNRKDALRPIGDFAFELFKKSIDCK